MKKFLIYTLLMVGGSWIGWQYLPSDIRSKTTAFIGTVLHGNRQEVQDFVGNELLPKDPEQKREALLNVLQEKIAELKKQNAKNDPIQITANKTGSFSNDSTEKLLQESDDLIKKLEAANTDASIGNKITDRVLNSLLPGQKISLTPGQIKQFCEENRK